MNDFHLIAVSCSSLHELVTQQKNDQLPVDLLTQLVGYYSSTISQRVQLPYKTEFPFLK